MQASTSLPAIQLSVCGTAGNNEGLLRFLNRTENTVSEAIIVPAPNNTVVTGFNVACSLGFVYDVNDRLANYANLLPGVQRCEWERSGVEYPGTRSFLRGYPQPRQPSCCVHSGTIKPSGAHVRRL